jgi:hypothetical protein
MPLLSDNDRQIAVKRVLDSRHRVITVWDAEMIGRLLDIPATTILQDVQALKNLYPDLYWML